MRIRIGIIFVAAVMSIVSLSCKREERGFRVDPPAAQMIYLSTTTDFRAGPATLPAATQPSEVTSAYDHNAYAVAQGQRLYEGFNCVGCHFHGGGGIGPPLMDQTWIYGARPDQIFATIVQGRPNGMPSFRGRIPDYQVWQIVAYVRSMGGLTSPDASPGREDHMQVKPPENSMPSQPTTQSVVPKSAEMPS